MAIDMWLTFVITAAVILAIPGPTIIYVITQSLIHGKKATLPLATGVSLGDATCILLSLLGLSTLLAVSSVAFTVVKLLGAGYLIYLGVSMLKNGIRINKPKKVNKEFNPKPLFKNAFAITSLNPKGIIFHSAFMPQFVNQNENIFLQFSILGLTFLALALFNTLAYSLLAGKFSQAINSSKFMHWFNFGGGLTLIGAGVFAVSTEQK